MLAHVTSEATSDAAAIRQLIERIENWPFHVLGHSKVSHVAAAQSPRTGAATGAATSSRRGHRHGSCKLSYSLRGTSTAHHSGPMHSKAPQRYHELPPIGVDPHLGPGCHQTEAELSTMSVREPARGSAVFSARVPRDLSFSSYPFARSQKPPSLGSRALADLSSSSAPHLEPVPIRRTQPHTPAFFSVRDRWQDDGAEMLRSLRYQREAAGVMAAKRACAAAPEWRAEGCAEARPLGA